jgi:transposase-like protein
MADKSTRSKRYTEEFRLQAAKLIVEGGATYHRAAQQLGVSDWALRCWVKAFRESGHLAAKGQVVPLAEELKAARRELAQLRLENEILKKAAAYFAKESL